MIFGTLGFMLFFLALLLFGRYTYLALVQNDAGGHVQSLLLGTLFMTGAFLCMVLNIIADLIRINRILIEDNLEHTKRARFSSEA